MGNDNTKLNNLVIEYIVYYNPFKGYNYSILPIGEIFDLTSGTISSLSTAYFNRIKASSLSKQYSTNKDYIKIAKSISESELCNPDSNGYITSSSKKEILLNIDKIDSGTSNLLLKDISQNDSMPAELDGCSIVFCGDHHEVACALSLSKSFVYLIDSTELKGGTKKFREKFIKRINNLIKYNIKF